MTGKKVILDNGCILELCNKCYRYFTADRKSCPTCTETIEELKAERDDLKKQVVELKAERDGYMKSWEDQTNRFERELHNHKATERELLHAKDDYNELLEATKTLEADNDRLGAANIELYKKNCALEREMKASKAMSSAALDDAYQTNVALAKRIEHLRQRWESIDGRINLLGLKVADLEDDLEQQLAAAKKAPVKIDFSVYSTGRVFEFKGLYYELELLEQTGSVEQINLTLRRKYND